jgi:hypothetical protein
MNDKNKKWIEAKKKFRLSNMHIQMAREVGMNPKKFGSLANHKQAREMESTLAGIYRGSLLQEIQERSTRYHQSIEMKL